MNYTLKRQPKNVIEIEVTISAEEMKDFYQEALKEIAQETTVSGFRPGKAPLELVEKEIGKIKILERAAEEAISHEYREIISTEKLEPIDQPRVEILKLAPDNPFVFKLIITLLPKVKICDYSKIKIQTRPIEIKEVDVDKVLKEFQQMRRKEYIVERPAQKGDRVEVDLEMFLDKVPVEGSPVKNTAFILGEDYYVPGLTDNLIGLKRGMTKEFTLRYPESHYDKNLAGRVVDFKIKVNNVYQIELPTIDDNFAKSLGNFETLAHLRAHLAKNLEEEAKLKEAERQEIDLLQQLITKSEFEELPEVLVESELDKIIAELKAAVEQQNLNFDDYLGHLKKSIIDLRKDLIPKAEERIKIALAIHQIAKQEKIEVNQEEIDREVEKFLAFYKDEPSTIEKLKSEDGRNYLKNMLLNRKVINWLKERVKLS